MRPLLALLLLLALPAMAVTPSERLADPALEARARDLSRVLRCLVCQNESIDESNADLARDVRVILRERLSNGDSDAQVLDFLTARYGQFVLLSPPLRPATWLLWFGPFVLLIGAGVASFLVLRGRATQAAPPALSADEQQRLDQLMREDK